MRLPTAQLFKACYGKYAIPAVNVFSMEQVLGLFKAASEAGAPIIVQMTPYARDYGTPIMFEHMIRAAEELYPDVVFATHLDHGVEAHCIDAIASGHYNSVMIDASHDSFEQNVARTKAVVEAAHAHGVNVEAELGVLSGVEDGLTVDEQKAKYTDPDECATFVEETGCDSLAVAVGTSHGAYKFSGGQGLQFDILGEIQKRLPGFPLVLHGGSEVNVEEIERINSAGGSLANNAKGVSTEEVQKAIQFGICKVNIATDLRLVWTRVHREYFQKETEGIDLVVPGKVYIEAYAGFVNKAIDRLMARGKAVRTLA